MGCGHVSTLEAMQPPNHKENQKTMNTDATYYEIEQAATVLGEMRALAVDARNADELARVLVVRNGLDVACKMIDNQSASAAREREKLHRASEQHREDLGKINTLTIQLDQEKQERVKFERWYRAQADAVWNNRKANESKIRRLRAKYKAKLADATKHSRPTP